MTVVELARGIVEASGALRSFFEARHRGEPGWRELCIAERLWLDLERDAYRIIGRDAGGREVE